jgi:beta-glucanase (GH16 family)
MHRARHSEASRVVRPRLVVALVVASAGLATAVWLPSRFDNAEATERNRERSQNQSEVFSDNFTGDRGSAVDRENWSLETGGDGFGAGELQFYTDTTRNARLDGNGNLVITARDEDRSDLRCFYGRCDFTSAKLQTRRTFTAPAGRAEARIQVPESQGVESAFRVLGSDDLAVMENLGSASRKIRGAVGDQEKSLEAEKPFSDDFHIYAVDWQPGLTVWSVDGKEFFRTASESTAFDEPFALVLNLAVGGDRAGKPENRSRFPQRMIVDFVKITAEEGDEEAPPATTPPTVPPTTEPTTPPTTPPTTEPTTPPPPATTPPTTVPPTTPPTTAPPVATAWEPFTLYLAGQRVSFDGITYQVLAPHTSLPGWEPPAVTLLFKPL